MSKEKFIYNTQTLRYEKVVEPLRVKVLRILGFFCAVVFTAFLFTIIVHRFYPSPKEKALMREIDQMELKYTSLNSELDLMGKVLNNVQERDASVHRMMFGMDPIDEDIWNAGIGGHERNLDLTKFKNTGDLLFATQNRFDRLKRQLTVQSRSLDTVINLAQNREKMFASIPSIKPVREDRLARRMRLLSGFGRRIHPVYKVPKMHKGLDFTAPPGTPIYATGDGKVVRIQHKRTGYGKNVVIDHGYGYKTLYAHMSAIDVKQGQLVKKGQEIGKVGNTGTSTAPHCHYEVHYNGNAVNPIHYCMDGLSPEEYQQFVDLASTSNQSFD